MSLATDKFGTDNLTKLLFGQAVPAAVGILVISIYGVIDTIFVGRWVGSLGIGAITVVLPIIILISSVGMAVGVGGSSMIARLLGANELEKASHTFGNQISLTLGFSVFFVILGLVFKEALLGLFGANGEVYPYALEYFDMILIGIPFLAWSMMSNSVIRTLGFPQCAMYNMFIPAVINLVLDPILIIYFDMGLQGAALATTLSYIISAAYAARIFIYRQKEVRPKPQHFVLKMKLVKEMLSIGSVTFARQGVISVLSIVLNNSLFALGGAQALSVYGIISRVLMFANFPVLGITQGFVPILGYNFGARLMDRVRQLLKISVRYATIMALVVFALIMIFTRPLVSLFTEDRALIEQSVPALRYMFLATPFIAINLIGSAYFQAIGKAVPSLLLTLTKQGFFLIPLILLLPQFFGLQGIWLSFPAADIGAALVTYFYFQSKEKQVALV